MSEKNEVEVEEKGLVRQVVEVFKDKMKELKPSEASIVFIVLSIIFTFGFIGFTAAIASGVIRLIQVIGQVVASGTL